MIKINIVAVGKVKEKYFQEGVNEYLKRLNRFCRVNVIEIKERNIVENPNPSEILEILKREGEDIKKELKGHVVVMAIEGKKHSSISFANFINKINFTLLRHSFQLQVAPLIYHPFI